MKSTNRWIRSTSLISRETRFDVRPVCKGMLSLIRAGRSPFEDFTDLVRRQLGCPRGGPRRARVSSARPSSRHTRHYAIGRARAGTQLVLSHFSIQSSPSTPTSPRDTGIVTTAKPRRRPSLFLPLLLLLTPRTATGIARDDDDGRCFFPPSRLRITSRSSATGRREKLATRYGSAHLSVARATL